MIKKILSLILGLFLLNTVIKGQETDLDKILTKYYQQNGFDKLEHVNSIVMTGSIIRNDLMPYKISKMRPDKYRLDFQLADLDAIQAYDGQIGWSTAPWTGNPSPVVMNEDATGGMKLRADFDGLLYKWKEKGHKAELEGKETINEMEYFKIKLTRKDGGIELFFINTSNFQLERQLVKRVIRGQEVNVLTIFSGNASVNGILFPFVIETLMDEQRYSLVEFETIELDVKLDVKIFSIPENQ